MLRVHRFDIALEVSEDMGPGGLFWGCLNGLSRFVCCCSGLLTIYCGQTSTTKTKSHRRGLVHGIGSALGSKPSTISTKTTTIESV